MTDNLFAPPKAAVADPEVIVTDPEVHFFEVSTVKFVVMSVCTLGLYQVYWFYRQWKRIQLRLEPDIVPWARAIFGIFYCYRCLEFIREDGRRLGIDATLPSGALTVAWIAASLASRLPVPYMVISFFAPLVLVPAQRRISQINALASLHHDKNTRFSPWNWTAVVLGGAFLLLILMGLMQQYRKGNVY